MVIASSYNEDNLMCSELCQLCPRNDVSKKSNCDFIKNYFLDEYDVSFKKNSASFRTFCALYRNYKKVVSREYLLEYGFMGKSSVLNNVNVVISELRTLLKGTEFEIVTVRGEGYILVGKR